MTAAAPPMPLKVSVVVPVYNPGPFIEPCIRSMLDQTLPPDQYEVIFVDDGSTDGTGARLDALAAECSQIRVIHIPNSGWAGKPRNVGVEHARGEYIQFLDADDTMPPEALERLHEMGSRNGADIVIGKLASNFRGVAHGLFRRNRETCTLYDAPLIDSVGPVKMFRTAFLREHDLRFPEERRRLEDQVFMVRAYFTARVVSILADRIYYFHRKRADGGNIASARIEPRGYYANLREVLDVVIANTDPGEFRNRLLRRFYRVEMLGRLGEPSFPRDEPGFRAELFAAARELAMDRIDPEIDVGLGAVLRIRSTLLREDRPAGLLALTRRCAEIRAATALEAVGWTHGRLRIAFMAQLVSGPSAEPLALRRVGDCLVLDPAITDGLLGRPLDVTGELDAARLEASVRDRVTGAHWFVPTKAQLEPTEEDAGDGGARICLVLHAIATINPLDLAGKRPLDPGRWEIWVRLTAFGLDRHVRLGAGRSPGIDAGCLPALLGDLPHLVVPAFDEEGLLVVEVDRPVGVSRAELAAASGTFLPGDGREISARLSVVTSDTTAVSTARLVLSGPDGERVLPAALKPHEERVVLVASVPRQLPAPPGRYAVAARLDADGGLAVLLGTVEVTARGRMYADGARRISALEGAARRLAGRTVGSETARRFYRGARRRLRRLLGSRYRSLRRRLERSPH